MSAKDLGTDRRGFGITFNALGAYIFDDTHHVVKAHSCGFQNGSDLGVCGAHLIGHRTAYNDLADLRVVLRGSMSG